MESAEEERKIKQTYLREAIVDAGYNPDRFIQYLVSIKENGADVDNWTLSELQSEVKTYKRLYAVDDVSVIITDPDAMNDFRRQTSTIFPDVSECEPLQKLPTITNSVVVEEPSPSVPGEELKGVVDPQSTVQAGAQAEEKKTLMISTRKPDPQQVADIEASIIDYKVVKPGFLSRSYAAYGIKTSLKEATIYRKEDDFNTLRNALVKVCPGYVIPALPRSAIKKLEPEFMQNRRAELELFLRKVMSHPLLKNINYVRNFVSIESDEGLENLRKEMAKLNNPKEISEFLTPTGQANVLITDTLIQSCNQLNGQSKQIIDEFRNLKCYNKELVENFNALFNTLAKVSASYRRIATAYNETQETGLHMVLDTLGDSFQKMMESCRQFQGSIDENFHKFFKYPAREMKAVKSLITQWNDYQSQYNKIKKKLKDKKETLFTQKQVGTWDLSNDCQYTVEMLTKDKKTAFKVMLANETREVKKFKQLFGYYCNKLPEEYKRICRENTKEFQMHMIRVSHMSYDIFDRLCKLWDDTHKYFSSKVN